jgi:hypothetical protein
LAASPPKSFFKGRRSSQTSKTESFVLLAENRKLKQQRKEKSQQHRCQIPTTTRLPREAAAAVKRQVHEGKEGCFSLSFSAKWPQQKSPSTLQQKSCAELQKFLAHEERERDRETQADRDRDRDRHLRLQGKP